MKAAWIESFGGPEVIKYGDFAAPEPLQGEVLVRVRAATLNHHDIFLRRGEIGRTHLPMVLGSDGAGEVVMSRAASGLAVGSRVAIYPVLSCGVCAACHQGLNHKCAAFGMVGGDRHGTHAELVVVPATNVVPIPDYLDFGDAAAVTLAGLTAWNMVYDEGCVLQGQHALVIGASGGVGVFVVRLLKRIGCHVAVVTSTPSKGESLRQLGADVVLPDRIGEILKYTCQLDGGGVDIAFNWVGGSTWRYVPASVRTGGRILVCGSVRSPLAELDIRQIFYKNVSIVGATMGTRSAMVKMLGAVADEPDLRAPVQRIIRLEDLPDAHRTLESSSLLGKIVVHP